MASAKKDEEGSEIRDAGVGSSGADTVALIRTSFPGRDRLVEHTYRDNPSFRELCEDYRRCAAVLHRWRQPDQNAATTREEEYAELLLDLGREIQRWLEGIEAGWAADDIASNDWFSGEDP